MDEQEGEEMTTMTIAPNKAYRIYDRDKLSGDLIFISNLECAGEIFTIRLYDIFNVIILEIKIILQVFK